MTCTPTYTTEYLPLHASCRGTCRGCTFSAIVATACTETGCRFDWTVKRTSCTNQPDDEFTGSADLPLGSSREVDFCCDPAESCARFRLAMTCTSEATLSSASD